MINGKDIILKIKRNLDSMAKFKVSRINKFKTDPDGDEIRYRPIKDISEIDKLHPSEWNYSSRYIMCRMVTGQAPVRERVRRIERKQYLYILCDCSGSMKDNKRFFKAGGVIMNRLQSVIHGDAEVTISFFDDKIRKTLDAKNAIQAKEMMSQIKKKNFSGGGTAIANCVSDAIKRIQKTIQENPTLTKQELIIITDGCDNTSSLSLDKLAGIRLHTFVVGGENNHLIQLARKNGGVALDSL